MPIKSAVDSINNRLRADVLSAVRSQSLSLNKRDRQQLVNELTSGLTEWAKPLMQPYRYKCLWGGRGSGKSFAIADSLLIAGLTKKIRVLCAREFQVSIRDSVHHLLKERISTLGLDWFYEVQQASIYSGNGSQFIFKGVRHNVDSIKSMSALTHLWIEEGQNISAESWRTLIPTIREEGSEIWVSFNPKFEDDIVYQELVKHQRDRSYVRRVNWDQNPWFPSVLDEERRAMQRTDPDAYAHIWEGEFWQRSDAQILSGKWIVDTFTPDPHLWAGPYHGADFGFADDPTVLVRCWVWERSLFIEYESYAHRLELDDIADRWKRDVPDCDRYQVYADSARPDTISYLSRSGIPFIRGAEKRKNSIEDGIAHLRAYDKIIVHERCPNTAKECRMYSYKQDRVTEQILPIVVDSWNHAIDSIRYSLVDLIYNTDWIDKL